MLESATKSLICFLEGTIATLHSKVEEAASEVTYLRSLGRGSKAPSLGPCVSLAPPPLPSAARDLIPE